MNLSFYIARRYLFAKKSHNAINVISMISMCGIAVATLALVCALSVFNGFTMLVEKSFSVIDPDLKIEPTRGKVFDPSDTQIQKVLNLSEVTSYSETLEENALAIYDDRQSPVLIKGVSQTYKNVIDTDLLIVDGVYSLKEGDVDYSVLGVSLAMNLGIRSNAPFPIKIYSPKRDVKVNTANPAAAFSQTYVYPAGIFALNQPKYDEQLMIISLDQARELFRYDNEVSSLDVKLKEGISVEKVKNQMQGILGNNFLVKDRFAQQESSFRMINIEKWVTFLILCFILTIAAFNIVGSLSMLIVEKSSDIQILKNMGASNKLITRIFLFEGWFISFIGTLVGLTLGLLLCFLQIKFGILKLGHTPGAFIIDAYPIKVMFTDILSIFVTVIIIGVLVVLYPVNSLRKRLLK